MKVRLRQGSRRGLVVDLPEFDAKKLINKGYAVSIDEPKKPVTPKAKK